MKTSRRTPDTCAPCGAGAGSPRVGRCVTVLRLVCARALGVRVLGGAGAQRLPVVLPCSVFSQNCLEQCRCVRNIPSASLNVVGLFVELPFLAVLRPVAFGGGAVHCWSALMVSSRNYGGHVSNATWVRGALDELSGALCRGNALMYRVSMLQLARTAGRHVTQARNARPSR
jgi:hypothetical protein